MFNDAANSSSSSTQTNVSDRFFENKTIAEIRRETLLNLRTLTDRTVVLVVGPRRSGKSTLINYLLGSKFYVDNYWKTVKLKEGEISHARMWNDFNIFGPQPLPAPCAYEKDGIVYCDTPHFFHCDNYGFVYDEEEGNCAIGFTQAGVSLLKAIQTLVIVIDVAELFYEKSERDFHKIDYFSALEAFLQDLSKIIKIEKFSSNILFAFTKFQPTLLMLPWKSPDDPYYKYVIGRKLGKHAHLLREKLEIICNVIKLLKDNNASYQDIQKREKEAKSIFYCLYVLCCSNPANSFVINVCDNGESRSDFERALKMQQALPSITKDQFYLGENSTAWQFFEKIMRDIAQRAAQVFTGKMSLPRKLYEKEAESTRIIERLKILEKRILALREGPPDSPLALEELREANKRRTAEYEQKLQDLKNKNNTLERKIKSIQEANPVLYRSLVWTAKNAIMRVEQLANPLPAGLTLLGKEWINWINDELLIKAAEATTANATKAVESAIKAAAETAVEAVNEEATKVAIEAVTAAVLTAKTTAETTKKTAGEIAEKRAAADATTIGTGTVLFSLLNWYEYESSLIYDDIPYQEVCVQYQHGTLQRDEKKCVSARGEYFAIFKSKNRDANVTVQFYVLSKDLPENIDLIKSLQEEITSNNQKIDGLGSKISLLKEINEKTSEREMLEAESVEKTETQAQLSGELSVLTQESQTVKNEIQTNDGVYKVLTQIAPLFSRLSSIQQFLAAYDRYHQLTPQQRDDDLFLAMQNFYINPDVIDWSSSAQKLGGGGAAEVYKRRFKTKETWIAVKQFFAAQQLTPEILHEAELMTRFKHPNIVKFYGITQTQAPVVSYALVMECMACSLYDVLYNNSILDDTLPVAWRIQMASQIIDAIIYLHEASILHRDIKSPNVLLSEDRQTAKLTDFGISKSIASVTNTVIGSPCWMAPELSETGATKSTDIFGFGIVIAEIVNRKLPFGGRILPSNQYRDKIQAGLLVFSDKFPMLSSLGRDCIKIAPNGRPTAQQCQARLK